MESIIVKDSIDPVKLLNGLDIFFGKEITVDFLNVCQEVQLCNILLEIIPLKGDFNFELCLYADIQISIISLVIFMCKHFHTEILISDEKSNPFTWILYDEEGAVANVKQIIDNDLFLIQKN